MYRLRKCLLWAPTPHSLGGIQSASGAGVLGLLLPISIHAPAPLAFSLYGGFPITTVIGSSLLILFASFRDFASAATIWGRYPSSSFGSSSVFVTNIRRGVLGGEPVRSTISVRIRNCATANGPSCISNAMSRFTAALIAS